MTYGTAISRRAVKTMRSQRTVDPADRPWKLQVPQREKQEVEIWSDNFLTSPARNKPSVPKWALAYQDSTSVHRAYRQVSGTSANVAAKRWILRPMMAIKIVLNMYR